MAPQHNNAVVGSVGKHSWACNSQEFNESQLQTHPGLRVLLLLHYCFTNTQKHIHTHTHFGFMAFTHICLQNFRAIITCKHSVLCCFNSVRKKSHLNDLFGVQSEVKISKDKMGKLFITLVCNPGGSREMRVLKACGRKTPSPSPSNVNSFHL